MRSDVARQYAVPCECSVSRSIHKGVIVFLITYRAIEIFRITKEQRAVRSVILSQEWLLVYHYIIYNHRVTTDTCIAECHLHFLTFIVGKREFHLLIATRAIVIEELSKFLIAPLRLYVVELHPFASGFTHPHGECCRHDAVLEYAIGPVEVLVRHIIEIQWVIAQIERQHLVFAQGHSRCDEPLILWEVHTLVISVLLISIIDDSIVFAIDWIQQ